MTAPEPLVPIPARAMAVAFGLVAVGLCGWWAAGLDLRLYHWFGDHRSPGVTSVMKFATDIGSPVAVGLLAVVIGVLLWWRPRRWPVALVPVVTAGVATVIETGLKQLVGRDRPPIAHQLVAESGPSFPSGHATVSAALLASVVLLAPRLVPPRWVTPLRVLAVIGIVVIGVSRLYLGVHYGLDVLTGWAIGVLVAFVVIEMARRADDRLTGARPVTQEAASVT